jgi:hypothetical protein
VHETYRERSSAASRPATYRERLRVEGTVLAAAGTTAGAAMLVAVREASDHAGSTVGQLVLVALLLAALAPMTARRSLAGARPVEPGEQLSGEPTALWKPPLVVLVLAAAFVVPGELGLGAVGWDAGVRVAGGCALVGLAQALLFARVVATDEARSGRSYVRLPGRGMTSGTKLGFFGGKDV